MSVQTPLARRVEAALSTRLLTFFEFCLVGATGMVIDVGITTTALGSVHYALANAMGFFAAVSWNFAGNWLWVFDTERASIGRQYLSYVGLHSLTFGLRLGAIIGLVELAGLPILMATAAGIGVAAIANFLGAKKILEDPLDRFDIVAGLNAIAHAVYGSRLRTALQMTGIYPIAYGLYMRVLAMTLDRDTITIKAGEQTVTMHAEQPAEIVSVMHTAEKEEAMLHQWIDAIEADHTVWDVGANLGVFTALAAAADADVHGFEPHEPTAARARENVRLNDSEAAIYPIGLAADDATARLALERAEIGTQTGSLDRDGGQDVAVRRADTLDIPTPDVVKIDVEGVEPAVLDGFGEMLKDVKMLFVECHGNADRVRQQLQAAERDCEFREFGAQTYVVST